MSGRVRSASGYQRAYLATDWEFCAAAAGSIATPDGLSAEIPWHKTSVPTTAAASLRTLNLWSLNDPPRRFDADDWWYRCRFEAPAADDSSVTILGFDGLATIADVWLNNQLIVASENMFVAHEVNVREHLRKDNELVIRFRALDTLLGARRARPRWRTPMIEHQQLRWYRTTLLGRTPGWSPPAAAVGPWRPIWLEQRRHFDIRTAALKATICENTGVVAVALQLTALGNTTLVSAKIIVERNSQVFSEDLDLSSSATELTARVSVPEPDLWWPNTHGEPCLYTVKAVVVSSTNAQQCVHEIDLGSVGFRTIAVNTDGGDFKISVNGVSIFCRGACWTPIDTVALAANTAQYMRAIQQVRAAGMNMLRVSGTMTYETEEFLEQCDKNGILIWQDLMFANMDYPADDAAFIANVTTEVMQQLSRLDGHACLAILCGNSEGEQQAAMWGATRDRWEPKFFSETIPALIHKQCPELPYWPSSAHGGAFPHQNNAGTTSYYGVGAYLRPLEDARRSEVKFATECLAFANIPEDDCIATMPSGLALKIHHPQWKARTPRDLGAGWDFDDVRDFYLKLVFGIDPLQLRYGDHDRYLELSRIVVGEVMAATFAEWRRKRSMCNGALVWFLRDLWPGAGWGIVDAASNPKSAYYYLRRALQPRQVILSDEGCNGLVLNVINESATPLNGEIAIALYRNGTTEIASARHTLAIPAHDSLELAVLEIFAAFYDATYAYKFGPAAHDLTVATLTDSAGAQVSQTFHLPLGAARPREMDLGLSIEGAWQSESQIQLTLRAQRFAQAVCVKANNFAASDNYFNIAPGGEHRILMTATAAENALRGTVSAANLGTVISVAIQR
jgi:beta-mannosidase